MDLPDLGDSSGRVLSAESEREYSEGLLRQLRNYGLSIDDAELVEYYETLANRLVQASGRTETRFHFELIDVPVVNAFASPGGLVVTFSELMLQADNESELAGVLSHEIAHVTQRHIARAMESSIEDVLPILIGAVALAVATRGQGDGGQAAMAGGIALMQQRQINFTRDNEHEADRVGIQTLAKAGFDPSGMADFFAKIGLLNRTQGEKPPEYLQSHPVTTTRIAEAKARADKLRVGTQQTSLDFALMRERLRVLTSRELPTLVRFYKDSKRARDVDKRAQSYGLALAQSRLGAHAEAREALTLLADGDPHRLSYQLALAEVDRAERQFDAADERYQRLLAERPGHRVISIAYARSQIERDTPDAGKRAVDVLRPLMRNYGDDPRCRSSMPVPTSWQAIRCAPPKPMLKPSSCAASTKTPCTSWSRPRPAMIWTTTTVPASTPRLRSGSQWSCASANAPRIRIEGSDVVGCRLLVVGGVRRGTA